MTDHTPTDEHLRIARAEANLRGFEDGYLIAHRDLNADGTHHGFPIERIRADALGLAMRREHEIWAARNTRYGKPSEFPTLEGLLATAERFAHYIATGEGPHQP